MFLHASLQCNGGMQSILLKSSKLYMFIIESLIHYYYYYSPPSLSFWSFLFLVRFSGCCLLLNWFLLTLPGFLFPLSYFFLMNLGFPSLSPLLRNFLGGPESSQKIKNRIRMKETWSQNWKHFKISSEQFKYSLFYNNQATQSNITQLLACLYLSNTDFIAQP